MRLFNGRLPLAFRTVGRKSFPPTIPAPARYNVNGQTRRSVAPGGNSHASADAVVGPAGGRAVGDHARRGTRLRRHAGRRRAGRTGQAVRALRGGAAAPAAYHGPDAARNYAPPRPGAVALLPGGIRLQPA